MSLWLNLLALVFALRAHQRSEAEGYFSRMVVRTRRTSSLSSMLSETVESADAFSLSVSSKTRCTSCLRWMLSFKRWSLAADREALA